jgi:hypothetical protein
MYRDKLSSDAKQLIEAGGRIMIADFSGGRVPARVRYLEKWGQHPLFNGWQDTNDWAAVGDFMKRGHDQLLSVNRARWPRSCPGRVRLVEGRRA